MRAVLLCLAALALVPAVRADDKGSKLTLTVSEKAGIRRYGYPVYIKLTLPREVTAKDRFRLLGDGKPVVAQFRSLAKVGEKKAVALDFNLNMGPLEKKTFTVEYGTGVKAGPEPKAGMTLEDAKGVYTVRSSGVSYVIDPKYPLLSSVRNGKKEYLRKGKELAANQAPTIQVVREGPLAVCLRVTSPPGKQKEKLLPARVVEMTFPRSKSWVECAVTVEGSKPLRGVMQFDLPLLLEGQTALVDFGAGTGVYTTLKKGQRALLRSRFQSKRPWAVHTGDEKRTTPFVLPAPGSTAPAEGWAHVMDSQRATAVAVEGFGRGTEDLIQVTAPGDLQLTRVFPNTNGPTRYRFWLHFVPMPVQVGALTSPQSMQSPLVVEVKPEK